MSDADAAVVGADWYGPASQSYSLASSHVSIAYIGGSFACSTAAGAAKRHAADLEEAKTDAKAAIRDAIEANEEMGRQRKIASAAHNDRRMALQRADGAALRGATAQAAGPAGAGEVISAGNEESGARDQAAVAGDRAALAERRASDAADLLEKAQKRGHEAKRRGDQAGEVAARVYRDVAGQATPPLGVGSPVVPVSLRGASPTMAGFGPFVGTNPFSGRSRTPAQARAFQIAAERSAAADRERELEGGRRGPFRRRGEGAAGLSRVR